MCHPGARCQPAIFLRKETPWRCRRLVHAGLCQMRDAASKCTFPPSESTSARLSCSAEARPRLTCNFITNPLRSEKQPSQASPGVTALHAENIRGGSKRNDPSSESGKCKPPADASERLFTNARSKYGAVSFGPRNRLERPSPRETTLTTECPNSFPPLGSEKSAQTSRNPIGLPVPLGRRYVITPGQIRP